jgi:hypothetical protein
MTNSPHGRQPASDISVVEGRSTDETQLLVSDAAADSR